MNAVPNNHPLAKLFAGLTEQTFLTEMGITDTKLVDYLTDLLLRFLHRDGVYAISTCEGRQLDALTAMMIEAERRENAGETRREIYRHAGDYALFWTGVYPEILQTRTVRHSRDGMVNFCSQGKRSYYLASRYADTATQASESNVLRLLSDEFELCAMGLRKVRSGWENLPRRAD